MNQKESLVVRVSGETYAQLKIIQILDETKSCVTDVATELLKVAADNACTRQALLARAGREPMRQSPKVRKKPRKRYRTRSCRFCGEKHTPQGNRMHERYCPENPNRQATA